MKKSLKKYAFRAVVLLAAIPFVSQTSQAQLNSNTASVVITATLLETLTLTALPSAVLIDPPPRGDSAAPFPGVLNTPFALCSTPTPINLFGGFSLLPPPPTPPLVPQHPPPH